MRNRERPQRPHRIDEKGMWPVKGIDVSAAARNLCPARSLDCAGDFEREFVEIVLALVVRDFALAHESPEISVGGNVIKSVVMHANVGDVRSHSLNRLPSAKFQELLLSGGIELQQGGTELEPLRPFGPTSRSVLAFDSIDGRAFARVPPLFNFQ